MIGKGVPVKLFIDGRMDVWINKNGYSPFSDYNDILSGTNNLQNSNNMIFKWLFIQIRPILPKLFLHLTI